MYQLLALMRPMDFFVPEFVNRAPQLGVFEQILSGRLARSVFLIEGEAEIGKSFLLSQLLHMGRPHLISRLDFRDGEIHNFLSLVQTAVQDLGPDAFEITLDEISRITRGTRHNVRLRSEAVYEPERMDRSALRQLLLIHFSDSELRDLCFDLHVDYENLPGQAKGDKARELILYLNRRGRLSQLIELGRQQRPDAPWDQLFTDLRRQRSAAGTNGDQLELYENVFFLPPADPVQQQALQRHLTITFFEELRSLSRENLVILSYDSYEEAPEDARRWLTGFLLDEVARHLSGVLVLIAGRRIPHLIAPLVPKTVITRLANFDLETVSEYWVHIRRLPTAALQDIYETTGGHPRKLADKANEAGGVPLEHHVMVI